MGSRKKQLKTYFFRSAIRKKLTSGAGDRMKFCTKSLLFLGFGFPGYMHTCMHIDG